MKIKVGVIELMYVNLVNINTQIKNKSRGNLTKLK